MYRIIVHINGDCKQFWDKYNTLWKHHSYDIHRYSVRETSTHIIHRTTLTLDNEKLVEIAYQDKRTGKTEKIVFETPSEKLVETIQRIAETPCTETR